MKQFIQDVVFLGKPELIYISIQVWIGILIFLFSIYRIIKLSFIIINQNKN